MRHERIEIAGQIQCGTRTSSVLILAYIQKFSALKNI